MSRHQLPHDRYDIVVGWDRALETFFAIAADTEADSDSEEVTIWLGTNPHEFCEVDLFLEDFAQELQRNEIAVLIPETLLTQLECDRTHEGYGLEDRPALIRHLLHRDH